MESYFFALGLYQECDIISQLDFHLTVRESSLSAQNLLTSLIYKLPISLGLQDMYSLVWKRVLFTLRPFKTLLNYGDFLKNRILTGWSTTNTAELQKKLLILQLRRINLPSFLLF